MQTCCAPFAKFFSNAAVCIAPRARRTIVRLWRRWAMTISSAWRRSLVFQWRRSRWEARERSLTFRHFWILRPNCLICGTCLMFSASEEDLTAPTRLNLSESIVHCSGLFADFCDRGITGGTVRIRPMFPFQSHFCKKRNYSFNAPLQPWK